MNTKNSQSNLDIELPPGATYLTTINDPSKGSMITPSTQRTIKPLPPTVNAQYQEGENMITVYAVVLIDQAVNIETLDIYQIPAIIDPESNMVTQPLYIVYEYAEEVPQGLYPYNFTFQISSSSRIGEIAEVEMYLWDEDPIGSRGTKTTVKPPTT